MVYSCFSVCVRVVNDCSPSNNYACTLDQKFLNASCNLKCWFFPSGKQKHCEDKVAAMLQGGVKPHEETHMPMVAFPIPSLPPSMLSCRCMRMSYVLRVSCCFLFFIYKPLFLCN